jgi:hypothetical protein
MKIIDAKGAIDEVSEADQVETVLARRHKNKWNQFWLSHGRERYPLLMLLVKGDYAYLNFLPADREAGSCSIGNVAALKPDEDTTFPISDYPCDDLQVRNEFVVPFSLALKAGQEYLITKERPRCVDWFEL